MNGGRLHSHVLCTLLLILNEHQNMSKSGKRAPSIR
jgi:hypothetical protein